MLNRIDLMGRMTRDPELRYTTSGTAAVSFSLACERDYTEPDNSRKADFIDCVAWRGTAETIARHLSKGRMIAVSGRLQIRDWTDREGARRRRAEVVVESFYFADSRPREEGSPMPEAPPEYGQGGSAFSDLADEDGDLPF